METPKFTLDEVRYADDAAMFERAEELWKSGKVGPVTELGISPSDTHSRSWYGYRATVRGGHTYTVEISARHIDEGACTCYMGQNDMLCKHMLALALAVLDQTGLPVRPPARNARAGDMQTGGLEREPPPSDLASAKAKVRAGLKKLKAYSGPSRIWFRYQRGLSAGAGMIADAVSGLLPSRENADYLWKLVLLISKKLATGGIDDSDGVVGGCINVLVVQLGRYAKEKPELKPLILGYCDDDTGFGFEDDLREILA